MTSLKKMIVLALLLSFALLPARRAVADETMSVLLKDTAYGGIIGALIGSAFMLLADEPGDHWDYIPKGAAVGVLVGVLYGLVVHSEALADSETEKQAGIALPTIETMKVVDERTQSVEVISLVNVLRYNF